MLKKLRLVHQQKKLSHSTTCWLQKHRSVSIILLHEVYEIGSTVLLHKRTPDDHTFTKSTSKQVFPLDSFTLNKQPKETNLESKGFSLKTQRHLRKENQTEKYNRYIFPEQPISQGASEVTGLTVSDNTMFQNGKPVQSDTYHCQVKCLLFT